MKRRSKHLLKHFERRIDMDKLINNQKGYTLIELLMVVGALIATIVLTILLFTGSNMLPNANPMVVGDGAGFWKGLLHGSFASLLLIASLFTDVNIYEVHNNGFGYNLGYTSIYILLSVTSTMRRR